MSLDQTEKNRPLYVEACALRVDQYSNGALSLRARTPKDNYVQLLLSPELCDQLIETLAALRKEVAT